MLSIAVLNQKGGVGKTTIATNLAAVAHLGGRRTLVLDLDRQGSAFDWYAARVEGSRLAGLNVARADKALTLAKVRDLTKGYDVAVFDGPPRLSDVTQAAAVAADVIVVPMRAGAYDYWASSETLDLLDRADEVRSELSMPRSRRIFVLNGAAPGTKLTRNALEAIGGLGEIAPMSLGNRVTYAESALAGESVVTAAPQAVAAQEIEALYNLVVGNA
jgi:chromosome partitioning protein